MARRVHVVYWQRLKASDIVVFRKHQPVELTSVRSRTESCLLERSGIRSTQGCTATPWPGTEGKSAEFRRGPLTCPTAPAGRNYLCEGEATVVRARALDGYSTGG